MTLRWGDPHIVARLTKPGAFRKALFWPKGSRPTRRRRPQFARSAVTGGLPSGALIEPSVADVRVAQIAAVPGRLGERVKSTQNRASQSACRRLVDGRDEPGHDAGRALEQRGGGAQPFAGSELRTKDASRRHGRACPGHPRGRRKAPQALHQFSSSKRSRHSRLSA